MTHEEEGWRMQRAEVGTYMEQRVVDPLVADLGVHEESDGVYFVAFETNRSFSGQLNGSLVLPRSSNLS